MLDNASSASVAPPPTLLILVGPPGTGKSTLARGIRDATGAAIIQSDAIRKALVPAPTYLPAESAWVHRVAHQRLQQKLSRGLDAIADATNLRRAHRRVLYAIASARGARSLAVVTWAPESVIKTRLERRLVKTDERDRSDATWAVYLHLRDTFESLAEPHIVINTNVSLDPSIRRICAMMER
ncbi:MAG: AAA family ATPase [Chloroflexota bacterium]